MPEREPVADPADRVTWHLAMDVGHGVEKGVVVALDGLLLVFILLELLAGVRATMRERKLVPMLATAGFLARRKEREPQEEDEAGGG